MRASARLCRPLRGGWISRCLSFVSEASDCPRAPLYMPKEDHESHPTILRGLSATRTLSRNLTLTGLSWKAITLATGSMV